MFMDILVTHRALCFSKIFPVLLVNVISLGFQPIIGRLKMRVSWEFNIYNLFKSFINTVLSFNTMQNIRG